LQSIFKGNNRTNNECRVYYEPYLAYLVMPSMSTINASTFSRIIANLDARLLSVARQEQYARNKYLSNGALYIILLLQ